MKVLILGTGNISSTSYSPSYLINDSILVDIGNGNYKNMIRQGVDISLIDNVLITHTHGDHTFDIPFLELGLCQKNKEFINVYGPSDIEDYISKLHNLAFGDNKYNNSKCFRVDNLDEIKINDIVIKPIKVIHGNKEAYAYKFYDGDSCILLSGDSIMCDSIINNLDDVNYLIMDTCLIEESDAHAGINTVIQCAKNNKNLKIVTTHMKDETKELLINNKELPDNIIIGNDYMNIM